MPLVRNMTWYQGERLDIPCPIQDIAGDAVDCTGFTLELAIRDKLGGTLLLQLTTGSGITILSVATAYDGVTYPVGTPIISPTAAQTASLDAGKCVFSVWRTDSGSEKPLTIGDLTVKETAHS